ncbi:hypothetical protein [Peterkaempfera sp. SMS 1(5)a]|uniref:hypothetical protein n=1 Tax=Peterkaempfera podocarpi TaxID=3232308 RepID=UPI00366ED204
MECFDSGKVERLLVERFLAVVERLSERAGCRMDEDDHPKPATLEGAVVLLPTRT